MILKIFVFTVSGKDLEMFRLKSNFLRKKIKNGQISVGDSEKMVGVIEEMKPKVTCGGQNPQENIFG